ncbi:MAG TPA: R2-like ligand-binding oxidase [Longimicrobiaceae bacterium]|nr:R2-like ligand-binding oxidase [Longimicrobiaceae bacterium]
MRTSFRSTGEAGLDHGSPPMRLWHKAKKLGVWDPRDVDFAQDARDWEALDDGERDVVLRLTSLFQGGEESVVLDLLPLMGVVAEEGRLEEEMYLTSFLWEEAKHVEAFRRFLDEVARDRSDLSRYHTPSYRRIFHQELPAAMGRLRHDPSPVAQAEASVTYNMIVEGVLAETGYHAYDTLLRRRGIMPGMQRVVGHLRRDESRHLAYGVFLLSRLVAEHGDPVWEAVQARLEALLEPAMGMIAEIFAAYPVMPFGLRMEEFADFALAQFGRRMARLERARGQTLAQVYGERLESEDGAQTGLPEPLPVPRR